jgi:hypothetical protein
MCNLTLHQTGHGDHALGMQSAVIAVVKLLRLQPRHCLKDRRMLAEVLVSHNHAAEFGASACLV